jgi:outer membrane protein OmpA-like peptidoglycan-associated protein
MRRTFMTSALAVVGLVVAASPAFADGPDLTLRLEPGVAIPLTQPQVDRFYPGADLALKPTLGLLPWLDANVTLSGLVLPSRLNGIDAGTAFGGGLGLRVKRPHDSSNMDTGFAATSPWIDTDAQLIGTGKLARPVFSLGIGAEVPTSSARNVWLGPFVRYADVVNSTDTTPGFNNTDAHVLIVGLTIELGPKAAKAAPEAPPPTPVVIEERRVEEPPAPNPPVIVVEHLIVRVQFPFDSAVPLPESVTTLQHAATTILSKDASPVPSIELDGHASSEGQVAYNDKLSVRRAQAVADLLVKAGIDRNKLTVKGFGSRVPVASNATEAGRVKNRRVEFKADVTITKVGAQ